MIVSSPKRKCHNSRDSSLNTIGSSDIVSDH